MLLRKAFLGIRFQQLKQSFATSRTAKVRTKGIAAPTIQASTVGKESKCASDCWAPALNPEAAAIASKSLSAPKHNIGAALDRSPFQPLHPHLRMPKRNSQFGTYPPTLPLTLKT